MCAVGCRASTTEEVSLSRIREDNNTHDRQIEGEFDQNRVWNKQELRGVKWNRSQNPKSDGL